MTDLIPVGPTVRSLAAAVNVAVRTGANSCWIVLNNDREFQFVIVAVLDDALLGNRSGHTKPCLVPMHAISRIEFGD